MRTGSSVFPVRGGSPLSCTVAIDRLFGFLLRGDLFKFETVVPVAMQIAGRASNGKLTVDPVGEVRRACRDVFRRTLLLQNIIPTIEAVLMAGDIPLPRLEREDD
jgi:hypothetical protein